MPSADSPSPLATAELRPEIPAGLPNWITAELLEDTVRLWQPLYTEPLTTNDACEILLNVGRLLDLLELSDD